MKPVNPNSVLLITLDSCRYDTFDAANAPNMKAFGPLHRAQAPSHFTYGSHVAMFVGFTPSIPGCAEPILDSKFAKLFRMVGGGLPVEDPCFELTGPNIVEGFCRRGYLTLGSGAVGWFDPNTETGKLLSGDFNQFHYCPNGVARQIAWLEAVADAAGETPLFCFLNIGETHVPYWHEGAEWSRDDQPCVPYRDDNRAEVCRERQRLCCEYVDGKLRDLLDAFRDATVMICADHGDCWGEDGLWEHGVSHSMTLTVPLIVRLRGEPVARKAGRAAKLDEIA